MQPGPTWKKLLFPLLSFQHMQDEHNARICPGFCRCKVSQKTNTHLSTMVGKSIHTSTLGL